jgi:hypothetical protein
MVPFAADTQSPSSSRTRGPNFAPMPIRLMVPFGADMVLANWIPAFARMTVSSSACYQKNRLSSYIGSGPFCIICTTPLRSKWTCIIEFHTPLSL